MSTAVDLELAHDPVHLGAKPGLDEREEEHAVAAAVQLHELAQLLR